MYMPFNGEYKFAYLIWLNAPKNCTSTQLLGWTDKKETGISSREYLQFKVIDVAKEKIFHTSKSLSEIGYAPGFEYP